MLKAISGEFPEFDGGLVEALLEQEDGDEGERGAALLEENRAKLGATSVCRDGTAQSCVCC